jgi:hypothetical protein
VRQACVNVAKGHYDLFWPSRLSIDESRIMPPVRG